MDAKMILGAALAILGFLMLTNTMTLILFEVVSYSFIPIIPYSLRPDGTRSSPTQFTPAEAEVISAHLVAERFQNLIFLKEDEFNVKVEVCCENGSSLAALVLTFKGTYSTEGGDMIAVYEAAWVAPPVGGKLLLFKWRISHPQTFIEAASETYARTVEAEPDGVFYINGVDVREKSTIELSGRTFHVSFTPTAHEKMISTVYVEVYKDEVKVDTKFLGEGAVGYEGEITLPKPGAYLVVGWIQPFEAAAIRKMSVTVNFQGGFPSGLKHALGALLLLSGAALMALSIRKH